MPDLTIAFLELAFMRARQQIGGGGGWAIGDHFGLPGRLPDRLPPSTGIASGLSVGAATLAASRSPLSAWHRR